MKRFSFQRAGLAVAFMALVVYLACVGAQAPAAKRVSPAGDDPARMKRIARARKNAPPVTKPIMFNTPTADAVLSALEIFPPGNPWNQLVDKWPVHPNSKAIVASVGVGKPLNG